MGAAEPETALAVLGSGERNELIPLLGRGAIVRENQIRLALTPPLDDEDQIVELAQRMAWLALRFAIRPSEVPSRLFDNTYDPAAGVRLSCLEALLHRHPAADETARAARFSVRDTDPVVHRTAALAPQSGERGAEALLGMAQNAALARSDRIIAMRGFLERAPPSRVVVEMRGTAERSRTAAVFEEALESARAEAQPALEELRVLRELPDPVRNAVRRALARITGQTAAGAVSIAEPAGGAISVADDRGQVSIVSRAKRRQRRNRR